jgi:hypothetical protein
MNLYRKYPYRITRDTPLIGTGFMNLIQTCGKIGAGVSVLVVLVAIGLLVLLIGCIALGAIAGH